MGKKILKRYDELENMLGKNRYEHSIRTAEYAKYLAKIYDVDIEKAYLAGLLHDCGKYADYDKMIADCKNYNQMIPYLNMNYKSVIHAKFGAIIAKERYEVDDENILNAIHYHATGRANMTKLEMIVYLADIIEEDRDYDGVEKLRKLADESLEEAMVLALSRIVTKLSSSKLYVVQSTIEAYNYFVDKSEVIF